MVKNRIVFVVGSLLLGACGGGAESTNNDIAAAMSHVAEQKDSAAAKVQAAERMKKLREDAEADAAQAKEDAYAALIDVPAEEPNNLDDACTATVQAFDAFQTQRLTGQDLQRWQATKQPDLDKLGSACKGLGNAKVAACQTHAFTNAGPLFSADDAPFIIAKCEEKVGVTSTKTAAL